MGTYLDCNISNFFNNLFIYVLNKNYEKSFRLELLSMIIKYNII